MAPDGTKTLLNAELTEVSAFEVGPDGLLYIAGRQGFVLGLYRIDPADGTLELLGTGDDVGRPEDVANTIVFLASDESRFINGSEIVVDNALSIQ